MNDIFQSFESKSYLLENDAPNLKNYIQSKARPSPGIMLFRMEERKLSNLNNVYITHGVVGYTQTINRFAVQECESCQYSSQ